MSAGDAILALGRSRLLVQPRSLTRGVRLGGMPHGPETLIGNLGLFRVGLRPVGAGRCALELIFAQIPGLPLHVAVTLAVQALLRAFDVDLVVIGLALLRGGCAHGRVRRVGHGWVGLLLCVYGAEAKAGRHRFQK